MIGIVVSRADSASRKIDEALQDSADWTQDPNAPDPSTFDCSPLFRHDDHMLRRFESLHLDLEEVAAAFPNPSVLVFVSRHAGDTGPLLTTHTPGNVGEAAYGGHPNQVPQAAPRTLRAVYHGLHEHVPPGYDIGVECTHHGPSEVGAPCVFVEVGSGPEQWDDSTAALAIARTVLALQPGLEPPERTFLGVGGGHYAPRFERVIRDTDWNVGHIAADWSLNEIESDTMKEMVLGHLVEQSGARFALIDGTHDSEARILEDLSCSPKSETWFRETDGISLTLVEELEDRLTPIDDGLRFGEVASPEPVSWTLNRLSQPFIEELMGTVPDQTMELINARSVAYETSENGNRLAGAVVLPDSGSLKQLVDELAELLSMEYDSVTVADDTLTIRETVFDPALARDRGVPEGPAFGSLAAGEPVTIDDRTITPEAVMRERSRRIPLLA